jgi:hypothetical protein
VRAVGRYQIRREIGRGGMATVYLAYQPELDRDVALKELRLAPEPGLARRFLREARLASALVHPSIVTVHDYFEAAGTPYIAMEYLPRGALRAHVGRLDLAQIGGVLEALLAGLAYAGARGVVHRDLKPENLMVTDQGRVKIADFGIAKATTSATVNLTTMGTTLGTPRYMAPERALGQDVTPASDLYSVGIIAFELLVGRTPFHDTVEPMAVLLRQINGPIPPVDSLVPDVGGALSAWVARLVAKSPGDRPPSAATAWDDLEEILIAQVGPRWSRGSALPARPRAGGGDDRRSPATAATRRDGARARGRANAAGAGGTRRPGAAGGIGAGFAEGAATVAPRVARARRRRARPAAVLAAVAAVIVVLGVAERLRGPGGVPVRELTSRSQERRGDLAPGRSAGDRARAADGLARDYEAAAQTADAGAAPGLRRVGRAYRRAADAARREDGSDYDDALRAARAGERALDRHTGAGDSASDDPSDDEPDENDNGD